MQSKKSIFQQEIIDKAKEVWKENFSDEYGYVSEKIDRLNSLAPEDYWVAIQMLHVIIRKQVLQPKLSPGANLIFKKYEKESMSYM